MIMNKWYKRVLNLVAITIFVFSMNIVSFAQGTTMISVSKNSVSVGDSVTISVTASESGTVTVKYTASMLNLTKCTVDGYSASGNSVSFSGKEGDLVFKAASNGTASIIVSSSSCSGSSTTLAIGDAAAPADTAPQEEPAAEEAPAEEAPAEEPAATEAEASATETPAPAGNGVGTLNDNGGFDINGVAYVVSERYSDSEMPSGFSKTTVKIGSSTYSEPTNGQMTLLYLKPADNVAGSGVFYLYDANTSTVSQFLMLGKGDNCVIVSNSDAGPAAGFTATTLDVTGGTATAYTIDGSEFFYVYGKNGTGAEGWYVYDATTGTVSRMDSSVLSMASTEPSDEGTSEETTDDKDVYVKKLDTYRKVIMGAIVLCVILLFVIINLLVKSRNKEDDDFDGDVFADAPSKSSRKLPKSIVFGKSSKRDIDDEDEEYDDELEDDEYYDDEEDYEEYDDDDETVRSVSSYESSSTYNSRRSSNLQMMDLNDL